MLCSLCGHNNSPQNRFCGMCGMPLENAVFKPKTDAVPPVNPRAADDDGEEEFDVTSAELTNAVPPLWDRVPPPPRTPQDPVIDMPIAKRETPSQSEQPVGVGTPARPAQSPRDGEHSSTVFGGPSSKTDYPRSSNSIFGLENSYPDRESERSSSTISGPSFLGLGSGGSASADYLLEDEESGHGRGWMVLLAIVLLAVLVGLQWRTEVQNQATKMASVVKARLQAQNPKPSTTAGDSEAPSPEAKSPESAKTANSSPAPSTIPQPETAKTIGGDQNPFKGAAPETPSPAPAQPSSAPAAAARDKDLAPNTEAAKSEKSAAVKETPPAADKQLPAPEDQVTPRAEKQSRFSPTSASREPARQTTVDDSMLNMAQKYLQGQGVPRSCEQGMVYLRQAVRQPSPRARSQMGALYATGTCVPQNRVEAYRWFTSALDLDPRNPWLARERDVLFTQMTVAERQRVNP